MYYDMRKLAKAVCENCGGDGCDKCLAKETPLEGGKVLENPAKIEELKDIPIEKTGTAATETKVCAECGGKGCEVCKKEGGKFEGEGAACTADSPMEGPGLQSDNVSTNGGPAGSPNTPQLEPVLGPKVSYYDMRPKKAAVETVAGESPLRQVRQMLTQAASRIEQLRNSPEAKFEEGEAAALAKAEDLVEKARKILFDAQVDPPARKISEEAPTTETAVEPPVAEPAPVEPAKV